MSETIFLSFITHNSNNKIKSIDMALTHSLVCAIRIIQFNLHDNYCQIYRQNIEVPREWTVCKMLSKTTFISDKGISVFPKKDF
jgi:hypothetical protein